MVNPSQQIIQRPRDIYLQLNTTNQSFLDMHNYLKLKGIKNNAFMLMLYDPDLARIDPRDPRLGPEWAARVLRECQLNYWYFLREIIRIPDQGGSLTGIPYKLHRGNLALNFLSLLNINLFEILPRQQFKTWSTDCRYLYLFNFGTTFSSIYFLNENHDKSKENLQHLKDLRALLPSYLRFDQQIGVSGKKLKTPDRVETLGHPLNYNLIKTVPSARNKVNAGNLIRGKSVPLIWFDEYAFIPFNTEVYLNGVPAYKTAALNAQRNGKAYGIIITTTPGDLMTEEGADAFDFMNDCTKFREEWYDFPYDKIMAQIDRNKKTNFVFVQYTWEQLGLPNSWFDSICKDMRYNWEKIRREILLEWNVSTPNAVFSIETLEAIKRKCKDPIKTILIFDKFPVDIYEYPEYANDMPKYTPIIGVDVAGGFSKDYSAFTIIDSHTTRPFASFKDNSIDPDELAQVLIEIVSNYMPNAIVNVEKTGLGAAVLAILKKSKIKRNLYYEIKDRVLEEKFDGLHVQKRKVKTRVYGLDTTKETRPLMTEMLKERARDHKDKFIIKELYEEFRGLEIKKNGRVEHSDQSHDDLTFSYLMAMYVWTYGQNLYQWNVEKTTIKTDEDVDDIYESTDKDFIAFAKEFANAGYENAFEEGSEPWKAYQELKKMQKGKGMLYHEWEAQVREEDNKALQDILLTKTGKEAYARKYNMRPEDIIIDNSYNANYKRFYSACFGDEISEEEKIKRNFNFANMFNGVR